VKRSRRISDSPQKPSRPKFQKERILEKSPGGEVGIWWKKNEFAKRAKRGELVRVLCILDVKAGRNEKNIEATQGRKTAGGLNGNRRDSITG